MSTKRRSNWYIYFITFAITLVFIGAIITVFSWFIFPDDTIEVNANADNNYAMEFEAEKSHSMTFLAMLAEEKGEAPLEYMIISYQAIDNSIVFIPLSADLTSTVDENRGNLKYLYETVGPEAVIQAIKNETGVECARYVKFDRQGLIELLESVGNVSMTIREDITYKNSSDGTYISFTAGEQVLSGTGVYDYITFPSFTEDEKLTAMGSTLTLFVNQNVSGLGSSLLKTYYEKMINNSVNNFTMDDFNYRLQAMLITIETEPSPAQYYIPNGSYNDDGIYEIAANSIKTMMQKTGQETE